MIKLFLTDLDGTVTDAAYYVSSHGSITKRFDTRDFHGLSKLHEYDIAGGIITSSGDLAIDKKMREFPFPMALYKRVDNKLQFVKQLIVEKGYAWTEVAYIGDDVNDIELLQAAGVAACPQDAIKRVMSAILGRKDGFVTDRCGGHGCVREFIDMVIEMNTGASL